MELINLMPMLIKIVELDFSWPLLNSGLYWVALGLLPLQEQLMIFTLIPHQDSIHLKKYFYKLKCQLKL